MFDYNPFVFYKYRFLKVFLIRIKEKIAKKQTNKAKQQQKQQKDRTKSTGL